jgi:hypothetical protein
LGERHVALVQWSAHCTGGLPSFRVEAKAGALVIPLKVAEVQPFLQAGITVLLEF